MKEYIVDFELYNDKGVVTHWLQQAFRASGDENDKFAFTQFLEYADNYWATENRGGNVRIKNIWSVEG